MGDKSQSRQGQHQGMRGRDHPWLSGLTQTFLDTFQRTARHFQRNQSRTQYHRPKRARRKEGFVKSSRSVLPQVSRTYGSRSHQTRRVDPRSPRSQSHRRSLPRIRRRGQVRNPISLLPPDIRSRQNLLGALPTIWKAWPCHHAAPPGPAISPCTTSGGIPSSRRPTCSLSIRRMAHPRPGSGRASHPRPA